MLSIKNIESSQVAASYFQKDDYYAGKEGSPESEGVWWGKGAETMGLTGKVDSEVFKELLDGHLPNGEQLGTVREKGGEKEHRPGWDLTFSAPKSVSVMSLVGGDDRLMEAHNEAVRETMTWIESNIAAHRKRGWLGINVEQADNMTAAMFQHSTSRDKDPQLHTHVVVLNANQDEDGKWRSLYSQPLYDHKMAAGNIYRAALAEKVQALGYEIEKTSLDGRFELAVVPDRVNKDMSQRAEAIREVMEERGLEGPIAASQAALMTRRGKTSAAMEDLIQDWQSRATQLGFRPENEVDQARQRGDVTPTTPHSIDQGVTAAVSRLSDKEAVFTNPQLLQWSLANSMGRGTIKDVEQAIQRASATKDVYATVLGENKAWTTPHARQQEDKIVDMWAQSRGAVDAPLSKKAGNAALAKTPNGAFALNDGQRAGALSIITQTDRFIGVEGRAGVGKTTTLGRVRPILEAQGYQVIGMAGNANAARTMQEEAGIKSMTVQKHLMAANKALIASQQNPLQRLQIRHETEKQVWVVDEASQLGSRPMSRLMHLADRLGARVVFLGDTRQLAAIDAGKPFARLFTAGMQRTVIDHNLRQKDQRHKDAAAQASEGQVRKAMATLSPETVQIENRDKRLATIVSQWKRMGDARATTTVLTARNGERIVLNEMMRDVLRAEGKLKGEVKVTALTKVFAERLDKVDTLTYKQNDLVQFGRRITSHGIEQGEYLRVSAVDQKTNTLTLTRTAKGREAETIQWNPREVGAIARNGVTIFRERSTSLAPGEKIQWGQNAGDWKLSDKSPLVNGRVLTVASIDKATVTFRGENGATISVNPAELKGQHWDHAYATTTYKSQGRTEEHVIVNAEATQTELFNQKAFVVAISRHKTSIKLFTDNTERFTHNIEKRLGDKTSAAESSEAGRLELLKGKMQELYDSWRSAAKTPHEDPAEAARRAAEEAKRIEAAAAKGKQKDQGGDRVAARDFTAGF